ncbi:MAG: hypothetical protein IJQ99_03720 [Synergistaceae bacterium]|nr:hypothetical protein [Synergistaceae bacterium]
MKKFLLKISIFAIYALMLQVVLPFVVDPFNVFHAEKIRPTGVEPNRHYIKMKYILNNPDKFNGFLFGSSRVGAIHVEKISNEKIYNMTYSVGLIPEHLGNLKTFLKNKIRPSKIYIGIDNVSCTNPSEIHIIEPMRCPYEYLCNYNYFLSLYLNPIDAARSLLLSKQGNWNFDVFYNYGWQYEYGRKSNYNWEDVKPPVVRNIPVRILEEALNALSEFVEICKKNDIELIIFTNPMHNITYMASVEENYFEFLEGVAKITDFYNFSSLNDVTLDNNNYFETSHYNAEVGDMIINVICNGQKYNGLYEQGFGVKVTNENVNEFINMLKKQADDFKNTH